MQLAIRKDGEARNAPIVMIRTGYEEVDEEDIDAFVATLGAAAALVPAAVPDSLLLPSQKSAERSLEGTRAM